MDSKVFRRFVFELPIRRNFGANALFPEENPLKIDAQLAEEKIAQAPDVLMASMRCVCGKDYDNARAFMEHCVKECPRTYIICPLCGEATSRSTMVDPHWSSYCTATRMVHFVTWKTG